KKKKKKKKKNIIYKNRLERQLSKEQYVLLLQRTQVSGGSQPHTSPASGAPTPSSDLQEHLHSCAHTHKQTDTLTHN
ncbi:hypothetical protein ACQP3F_26920, partial [Escherichia coli]